MSTAVLLEPAESRDGPVAPIADDLAPRPRRPKSPRYESLDMWRGLCCLMLVVFHTTMQVARHYFVDQSGSVNDIGSLGMWLASRAWIGVPIFFVISGYCIMAALYARRKRGGVFEFAKRRFWRIYPPYWTAIALSAAVIIAMNAQWPGLTHEGIFTVPIPERMTFWQWFGNLTLTESWRHCVFGGDAQHLLPNTWTLCYEEQFYVIAALILYFASQRLFTAAAVVTVLIFIGKTISWSLGWDVEGSLLDGRWFEIGAGILLFYRVNAATPKQIVLINSLFALGVLVSLRSPGKLMDFYPNHDMERFIAYSFALLASVTYPFDQKLRQSGWLKPLWLVGAMSYSVYLCHPLIAKGISFGFFRTGLTGNGVTLFFVVPLCLAISLAVAYVFHRLVERHFIPPRSVPSEKMASAPAAAAVTTS